MKAKSLCGAFVLATALVASVTERAESCGLFGHCHKCRSSSYSSSPSSTPSNNPSQSIISIDAASLLEVLLKRAGSGGERQNTTALETKIDKLTESVSSLSEAVKQIQRNTEAIEALKVGQEANANRVNNEFATKKEVGSLIEAAVKSQLGDIDAKIAGKIDERFNKLKEELNKDLDGREIKTAMNATGATHRLSQDLKPFTTSDAANNAQHADTWAKGKFLRVEGTATNGRLQVHPTYADAGTYWVSEDRLEKLSDLVK
jgi:hypothetical protein